MNLASNAIKFTNAGHVEVRLSTNGRNVVVAVEDTGVGIGENTLEKIFDEFKQESEGFGRSYEGSGLGLTIIKHLLDLMEGDITVDSAKGEGSTFTVTIPSP